MKALSMPSSTAHKSVTLQIVNIGRCRLQFTLDSDINLMIRQKEVITNREATDTTDQIPNGFTYVYSNRMNNSLFLCIAVIGAPYNQGDTRQGASLDKRILINQVSWCKQSWTTEVVKPDTAPSICCAQNWKPPGLEPLEKAFKPCSVFLVDITY